MCLDEKSKQQGDRHAVPDNQAAQQRVDYEYERTGTAIFSTKSVPDP